MARTASFIIGAAVLALAGTSRAGAVPAAPGLNTDAMLVAPMPTTPPASMVTSPPEAAVDLRKRQAKPTLAFVEGYQALGCFNDGRILTVTSTRGIDMTPNLCRNWCSVQSAPIFGLTGGTQCLCGEEIEPHAAKAPEDECSQSCFGASSMLCGDRGRLNLYAPTSVDVGTFAELAPTVTPPSSGNGGGDGGEEEEETSNNGGGNSSGSSSGSPTGGASRDGNNDGPATSSAGGGVNLPIGAVVGIAIGAAAISAIVSAVIVCFFCRRRQRRYAASRSPRMPPSQPMVYANTAPSHMPPPPSSHSPPVMTQRGPHEVHHEAYKPSEASVMQSYSLSPGSASPPPVSALSAAPPPPQPQYAQPKNGAQELHHQTSPAAGPYEMK